MVTKREYGSGGISWLSSTKVRLRVWVETDDGAQRRTRVVRVAHKDHGGRGEAAEELEAFVAEIQSGKAKPGTKVTLGEMLDAYVDLCRTNKALATGTITSYEDSIKRLPLTVKTIRLPDLGTHDLDSAYAEMSAQYADNTIRLSHAAVHAALGQALTWKYVTTNVAEGASLAPLKRKKQQPLPLDDVTKLVVAALAPRRGYRDGDIVVAMAIILATLLGARRGELAGLRWDDLEPRVVNGNVVGCIVRIERQWVPGRQGQYLKTPKMAEEGRIAVMGLNGLREIEQYRARQRELLGREPEGWLLSYDAGITPVSAKAMGDAIAKLARREGLKATTHRFRKILATQFMAAGVDANISARRMGHTTEVMLSHYVVGADDRTIAAAETIEARLVDQGFPVGAMLELPVPAEPGQ